MITRIVKYTGILLVLSGLIYLWYTRSTPTQDVHNHMHADMVSSSMIPADRDLTKLDESVAQAAELLLLESKNAGLHIIITEWRRSEARQRALYAQWRTTPGKVVTRTLKSNHMTGKAFDIAFDPKRHGSTYPENFELREQVWIIGESLWLERWWRWKTRDMPHFQMWSKGLRKILPSLPGTQSPTSDKPIWERLIDSFVELYWEEKISVDLITKLPEMLTGYVDSLDILQLARDYIQTMDVTQDVKDFLLQALDDVEVSIDQ